MEKRKVIDTCVFIECFRGSEEVADFLAGLENKNSVVMTALELYEGAKSRGKDEINKVKTYIKEEKVKLLPITVKASKIALGLMEKYATLGLKAEDALIAAVCLSKKLALITADKHFDILEKEGLEIIKLMGFQQ